MPRHSIEFTPEGLEILSQVPIEVPLSHTKPLTLQEEIRRMIAVETSRAAEEAGFESIEEADDFDVDDDDGEFHSPYEILEMHDEQAFESEPETGAASPARSETAGAPRDVGEDPAARQSPEESLEGPGNTRVRDRHASGSSAPPAVD